MKLPPEQKREFEKDFINHYLQYFKTQVEEKAPPLDDEAMLKL